MRPSRQARRYWCRQKRWCEDDIHRTCAQRSSASLLRCHPLDSRLSFRVNITFVALELAIVRLDFGQESFSCFLVCCVAVVHAQPQERALGVEERAEPCSMWWEANRARERGGGFRLHIGHLTVDKPCILVVLGDPIPQAVRVVAFSCSLSLQAPLFQHRHAHICTYAPRETMRRPGSPT